MARKKKQEIKVITLDTETIGLDGDLKRIAVYDGSDITYGYAFEDVEKVLNRYADMDYEVHVYIHNLEFDIRRMPKIFEKGNIIWSQTKLINGKYATITCMNYTFHDSFKILPESLASLSESFDLEHGKLDLWDEVQITYPGQYENHVDFLTNCDKDDPLYLKYLGYDVISLYELIQKLIEISGIELENFVHIGTTASLSRYIFKNGYKGKEFRHKGEKRTDFEVLTSCKGWSSEKHPANSDLSYKEIEEFIRGAYCGGRTEVFKPHCTEGAYHYDVNSLYPYAMGQRFNLSGVLVGCDFPIGWCDYISGADAAKFNFELWMENKKGLGFLECTVFIPFQHIPPLPVKRKKLIFPCGEIKGTWTYTELEYAIKNCGVDIVEYHNAVYFKNTFPVFENFIKVFSDMKTEAKERGESALVKFSKLVQNTGYGYCGMRRDDKTELQPIEKEEQYKENGRFLYSNEEFGYCEIQSIVIADYIQVQIAAYVTSYARLVLLDALRTQSEKGEVYYCDTDSIVCSEPLPPEMVHKSILGKWDLEGELISGIFLQPKVYFENKKNNKETVKFKGVSRDTANGFDEAFYNNILTMLKHGSTDRVTVEQNKELLRSVKYTQKMGISPTTLELRDKQLNLENKQKRNMFYAENRTEPYYFDTLQDFETFNFNIDYKSYYNKENCLI